MTPQIVTQFCNNPGTALVGGIGGNGYLCGPCSVTHAKAYSVVYSAPRGITCCLCKAEVLPAKWVRRM